MMVCKESALANHAAVAKLYEQLSAGDRQHLARILGKLIESLEHSPPAGEAGTQKR